MLGIYTRLSREDEASNSIKNQLREGKQFAKENNLDFKHYNEGEGISGGADIEVRPALKELMGDIEAGVITSVWFRNQNRLERNSLTYAQFATLVKSMGTEVYFGDKLQDFKDPTSNLQGTILSALNQYQRELQGKQTQRALLDNVKAGKAHGIVPYGYKADKDGMLVINEEEEKNVRKIYELSLKGKGTNKIAELFNELGIPTRYHGYNGSYKTKDGKKLRKSNVRWQGNTIRGIITNKLYKGERKWKNKVIECPAIFDADYWQKVNDNLQNNRNNSGKVSSYEYLLKGIIKCGRCGRNYYGRTRENKKDHYYMCSSKRYKHENCGNRSINIDFIEGFVWTHLFEDEAFKDLVKERIEQVKNSDEVQNIEEQIKSLKTALNEHRSEQKNLIEAVKSGVFDPEDIRTDNQNLKSKIRDIERQINTLQEQRQVYLKTADNEEEILNELSVKETEFSFKDKQDLVGRYIERIVVFYDDKKHHFLEIVPKIGRPIPAIYIADSPKFAVQLNPNVYKVYRQEDKEIHRTKKEDDPTNKVFKGGLATFNALMLMKFGDLKGLTRNQTIENYSVLNYWKESGLSFKESWEQWSDVPLLDILNDN